MKMGFKTFASLVRACIKINIDGRQTVGLTHSKYGTEIIAQLERREAFLLRSLLYLQPVFIRASDKNDFAVVRKPCISRKYVCSD